MVLDSKIKTLDIEKEAGDKVKAQFNKDMLADSEVIQNIVHLSGNFVRKLCEVWSRSQMKNMTLTSVGIAIAHANLRRKTGISIDLKYLDQVRKAVAETA